MLHGAGETPVSWMLVQGRLSTDIPTVTVGRAAPGRAAGRSAAALLQLRMDEISAVVPQPPAPVLLVGHSFGGLLARAWAHRNPGRVAGLVLVDATPPHAADARSVAAGLAASAHVVETLARTRRVGVVRALVRARMHPLYPEQRHIPMTFAQRASWADAVVQATTPAAAAELSSVHRLTRLVAADPPPHVPALVVASSAYGPRWVRWQHEVADTLGARLVLSGDRSHNIHLRHPDLVAEAVSAVHAAGRDA
jgi:pimeloyl-ACP methyl ester carboxylesterase